MKSLKKLEIPSKIKQLKVDNSHKTKVGQLECIFMNYSLQSKIRSTRNAFNTLRLAPYLRAWSQNKANLTTKQI